MVSDIVIPKGYPLAGFSMEEIITSEQIEERIKVISSEISKIYFNQIPVIICVLNGAFMFMADLVRSLDIQCEVDFIKIDSYGGNDKSTGTVRLLKDISTNITGKDVIVVEDIVDTGLSLKFLFNRLNDASPKTLRFATLLYKNNIKKFKINVDWKCFDIDDHFVVGYGLDLKQIYRGLSSIYAIKKGD